MLQNPSTSAEDHGFPPGTVVVKQSVWAWIVWVIPWVIVAIALIVFSKDIYLFLLALILGPVSSLPRFFSWRSTLYIATGDALIFQRGLSGGSRQYSIPASDLREIRQRPGLLGDVLRYRVVDVILARGKVTLGFMPMDSGFAEKLEEIRLANPPVIDTEQDHPSKPDRDPGPYEPNVKQDSTD